MTKPKTKEKSTDPGYELIRKMPPRSRTGATAWLLRESGTEPMMFEMAQALGLIEFRPVVGQWVGSLFGVEDVPSVVKDAPAPVEPVEVVTAKRTPAKPVRVAPPANPTGQLNLF